MKKAFIVVLSVLCIITALFFNFRDTFQQKTNNSTNNKGIIDEILKYNLLNDNIDYDFLMWINNNYKDSLDKIDKLFNEGTYSISAWHDITNNSLNVLLDMYNNNYVSNDNVTILKNGNDVGIISFVGDVSLADNFEIMPYYDSRDKGIYGILEEDIINIMKDSNIMVANNEFTISNRGEKLKNKLYNFRASTNRVDIYKEMGVNLVTLANNHVYDYGEEAFLDTLDTLKNVNIPYIGAGINIDEAKKAYYFILNGYKIAFVNATRAEKNIITPEATNNSSGVLRAYDPTLFTEVIRKEKETSDYVIALIHWGKEDSTELENVQINDSKTYIDAGADIIVGTHAHVLQGIEFYNNKPIIYNLGDFIFNAETKDTGILSLKLDNKGNFKYYFIPCLQNNRYTSLLKDNEKKRVLAKMTTLSNKVIFNENGEFYSQ